MNMRETEQMLTGRVSMSARLEAIVELAQSGDTVCDVGCDHAHVPIRLIQSGCYRHAIGMDVIEGPLGKAAGNLALYGMEDKVELRLSDGLDAYSPGEADTLVITGMGGTLMEEILLRDPIKTKSFSALVLGPQSDPDKVRAALRHLGFVIKKEKLIFEDGKYYPVIRAESGRNPDQHNPGPVCETGEKGQNADQHNPGPASVSGASVQDADHSKPENVGDSGISGFFHRDIPGEIRRQAEDMFGPVLLKRRDPVLFEFLKRRTAVLEEILRSISEAAEDTCKDPALVEKHQLRQREIEHNLIVFKAALTVYGK